MGCHFLLQCMKVKSESEVTQSCPTLSDPMDCSLPGSSVHGIFQARVLEWGAIAFSCVFLEDNMTLATTDSPTSMEEAYFPQDYISNVFFYFLYCVLYFFFPIVITLLLSVTKSCLQRRQWHPTPVLLPGKSHGWRGLVGHSPWGR